MTNEMVNVIFNASPQKTGKNSPAHLETHLKHLSSATTMCKVTLTNKSINFRIKAMLQRGSNFPTPQTLFL